MIYVIYVPFMVINLERGMIFICYLYRRQRKRKKTANRFLREITKKKKKEEIKRKEEWCYQALLAEPERLVSL